MPTRIDISGTKYGLLVAIKRVSGSDQRVSYWECACDCGVVVVVRQQSLVDGRTKSCGCNRSEMIAASKVRHGHAGGPDKKIRNCTSTYATWCSAIRRCEHPTAKGFPRYGGRGIRVCDRWRSNFSNFLEDMGERPKGTQIDRVNNDGHYEPGNCRWATPKENGNNTSHCHFVTAFGRTQTIAQWSEETGLKAPTIRRRLKDGWAPEKALKDAAVATRIYARKAA